MIAQNNWAGYCTVCIGVRALSSAGWKASQKLVWQLQKKLYVTKNKLYFFLSCMHLFI